MCGSCGGACVVAGGMRGCWGVGGVCGCRGACVVAGGHAWLPGGMRGCWGACMAVGGMHGCQRVCVTAGRQCMAAGGCAWLPGGMHGCGGHAWLPGGVHGCRGHVWLLGGMRGCRGACVAAGGACMAAGGCVWLLGGMHGCWGACVVGGVCMPCDLSHHAFDVTCMLSLLQLRLNRNAAAYIVLVMWHACPPPGQNCWHTLLKILPCPNFVAGGKNPDCMLIAGCDVMTSCHPATSQHVMLTSRRHFKLEVF